MIAVRNEKIIAYKTEQVRGIAFNLRKFIKRVAMDRWSRLGSLTRNESAIECIKLENERSSLNQALEASICECPGCFQTDRDMYYNSFVQGWYCTKCVESYRSFYYKNKKILDQGGFVGDFDEEFHKSFL